MKIDKVSKQLPDLPKKRSKNLFDILGIERRETINSKLVAYFFSHEEEHGFGTLFFDSLMQLIEEKDYIGKEVGLFIGSKNPCKSQALIESITLYLI